MKATVLVGDVRERLSELADGSVQTCVTSPPYWGLRDYGHEGQLGLEHTPEEYVAGMVEVFREVRRVLADDGTLWLNLGDSYAGSGKGRNADGTHREGGKQGTNGGTVVGLLTKAMTPDGLKEKDLVGVPWRTAFALQDDGWWLRQDIIWAKPNPMPESVKDRCTKAHEYLFLLTKSARYYYDAKAIAEASITNDARRPYGSEGAWQMDGRAEDMKHGGQLRTTEDVSSRNRRSVWTIATKPYSGAHFAVMPEALVEPCVLAGSRPGDTVLDPFTGSGTVGVVALKHGRNFVGTELNPEYATMAEARIRDDGPLFNEVETV